jgi:DNA mismatch endonuclease (patch repair protein)
MNDIVDPITRSKMMANIKGKNTKPELAVRSALHRMGYRFRLHRRDLPGRPDIVLPKYKAVIFVNGCFWHGHFCHLFRWPKTRENFWREKILANKKRDQKNIEALLQEGWRVCIIWECSIRKRQENEFRTVISTLIAWIEGSDSVKEISLQ